MQERSTPAPAVPGEPNDTASRKNFLRLLGGGAATASLGLILAACGDDDNDQAAGGGAMTGTQPRETAGANREDLKILNYALTLEYVEADFYRQVIDSGEITDPAAVELAKTFGEHEQAHVETLTQTITQLGGTPAQQPTTNFQEVLAGGPEMILATAAEVENLGAAAYLGQAGRITNPEILTAALTIHSVEARHAAALNQAIGLGFRESAKLKGSIPDGAFATGLSMDEVLKRVQPFLAS
jgi:rubrerythrin